MSYNKGHLIINVEQLTQKEGDMEEGKERKDRVRGKKKCHH